MKIVNENERIGVWAVTPDGTVGRVACGTRLDFATTRAVVIANSADEAKNEADAAAFKVGVKNSTADEPAEITIYGEIGNPYEASDARSIGAFLRGNKGKPIVVRINSGGGLVYDGLAIHNSLVAHDGQITTIIEGIAGSAASVIAVGGSSTQIYENAQFFIHRASMMAIGNRDLMAEAIEWLDAIDEAIARTYKAKTGKALEKLMSMMRGKVDGTLFSAKEAVAEKFCNEIIPLKRPSGKNEVPITLTEPVQSKQFVEAARAMRQRCHSELFIPADSQAK